MIDFKSKVKEACKIKEMQQKDLAEKLGITDVGLSATLHKNNPKLSTMEAIAEALDVSLVELLSGNISKGEKPDDTPKQGGTMRCPHCGGSIEIFVRALHIS